MNRMLSRRFVKTSMAAISILLILIIGAINTINLINTNKREWETLETVSRVSEASKTMPEGRPEKPASPGESGKSNNSDGSEQPAGEEMTGAKGQPAGDKIKPDDGNDDNPPQERARNEYDTYMASNFFYVDYDADGELSTVDVSRTSQVSEEEAVEMADAAIESGEEKGRNGDCIYLVREVEETGESSVVFLDVSKNSKLVLFVFGISVLVGVVCWLLMLLITLLLSKRAVRPIAENIERQKRFVTDAGHEIKTPLAIIQSNADAMELYNGSNKWLGNIKFQVERLTKLTNDLLSLARMDESESDAQSERVNLTEAIVPIIEGFATRCESKNLTITDDIADDVIIKAKQADMEKLVGILLDNAVKYGKAGTDINVVLNTRVLSVENECEELPDAEPDKLFERFYRTDKARTQESGGCGIGLSIAKSIAESRGGRIRAEYLNDNRIKFVVELVN